MNLLSRLLMAAAVLILPACGGGEPGTSVFGGDERPVALFTSAPSSLFLAVGATSQQFSASGGTPSYTVVSGDSSVASVTQNGNSFVINGVAGGKTFLTIKDSLGAAITAEVTVGGAQPLFTSAPPVITLAKGEAANYTIGGGSGGYDAASGSPGVASVSTAFVGGVATVTVTGASSGAATIAIRDAAGTTLNLTVNVGTSVPLFTSAPTAITLRPGAPQTYTIGGGESPYRAESSDTSIATALATGTGLSITGVAVGTTSVVVKDARGASVNLAVTVTTNALPALAVTPESVTACAGDTLNFFISGGEPTYSVTSNNPTVATVTAPTASGSGQVFAANLVQAGLTVVSVVDARGQTKLVTLQVDDRSTTQCSALVRLLPVSASISEAYNSIALTLSGGSSSTSFRAFSSDVTLATVPATFTGSTLTVSGVRGVASNQFCVATSTSVTITVVDPQGRSTTSALTFLDNNGAATCP